MTRVHNMLEVRLLYRKLENYNKCMQEISRAMLRPPGG